MRDRDVDSKKFSQLGSPNRVWAVPAIHSETQTLIKLHDHILERFQCRDRIVYLGNYTGYGKDATACIDEILTFRRLILSIPGVHTSDLTYVRGVQEEMWQKLLQLQFAPNPSDVLLWMLGNGMPPTLESYGISPHDGIEACNNGVMSLTKWTDSIRQAVRKHAGHEAFTSELMQAAHTNKDLIHPLLFVHSGLDHQAPLEQQGDAFWWAGESFSNINAPYKPFEKVIRGYDPKHKGVDLNCVTATIDGGCGFGGNLVCAGFDQGGDVFELLEA